MGFRHCSKEVAGFWQPAREHFDSVINLDVAGPNTELRRNGGRLLGPAGSLAVCEHDREVWQEDGECKEEPHPKAGRDNP